MTQWMIKALEVQACEQRAAWMEASWEAGVAEPAMLHELRTRADAYRAIAETDYHGVCAVLEQQPIEGN